jgi:hypothetical protein
MMPGTPNPASTKNRSKPFGLRQAGVTGQGEKHRVKPTPMRISALLFNCAGMMARRSITPPAQELESRNLHTLPLLNNTIRTVNSFHPIATINVEQQAATKKGG